MLARWSGILKLPPSEFYTSTLLEVARILEAHQASLEESYYLNLVAGYNANGYFKVKNFKAVQPFPEQATSEANGAENARKKAEESLALLREHIA